MHTLKTKLCSLRTAHADDSHVVVLGLKVVLMTDTWGSGGPILGSSDPEYQHPTAGDLEVGCPCVVEMA